MQIKKKVEEGTFGNKSVTVLETTESLKREVKQMLDVLFI